MFRRCPRDYRRVCSVEKESYLYISTCCIVKLLHVFSVALVATDLGTVFSLSWTFFASSLFTTQAHRSQSNASKQQLHIFHLFLYILVNQFASPNTLDQGDCTFVRRKSTQRTRSSFMLNCVREFPTRQCCWSLRSRSEYHISKMELALHSHAALW